MSSKHGHNDSHKFWRNHKDSKHVKIHDLDEREVIKTSSHKSHDPKGNNDGVVRNSIDIKFSNNNHGCNSHNNDNNKQILALVAAMIGNTTNTQDILDLLRSNECSVDSDCSRTAEDCQVCFSGECVDVSSANCPV